jgi:hypothetical protein
MTATMKSSALKKHSPLDDKNKPDSPVALWLEAIIRFYRYYYLLFAYIGQRELNQNSALETTSYIGQWPIDQLVKLICTMQAELANLTQDMHQVDNLQGSTNRRIDNQLASHTLRLNELNYQAQTRLRLIKQSAS